MSHSKRCYTEMSSGNILKKYTDAQNFFLTTSSILRAQKTVVVVIFGIMVSVYRKGHELETLRDQRKTCLFIPQIPGCTCFLTVFLS